MVRRSGGGGRRRGAGSAPAILAVACVAAVVVALPTPAWAAPTTQVVQGEVIRLVSVADWDAASALRPGVPVRWDVAVTADAPDPGVVQIAVSARGDAPLVVDIAVCDTEWESAGCPGGEALLRSGWRMPRDGGEIAITDVADTEEAHLRLVVALGSGGDGGSTDIRVIARGAGESVTIGPDGDGLATTGPPSSAPWALGVGGVLVAVGTMLVGARHRRDSREAGRQ